MCGAHQLTSGAALATSGVHDESNVALLLRLRGGNNAKVVQLTVQPRVQKEKWSLYWKESMSTKTIALEPVQLQLSASTTIAEVRSSGTLAADFWPHSILSGSCASWQQPTGRGREQDWAADAGTSEVLARRVAAVAAARETLSSCLQVQQLVAKRCGWDPVGKLSRLEGFTETWERVLHRGRELKACSIDCLTHATLASCGPTTSQKACLGLM